MGKGGRSPHPFSDEHTTHRHGFLGRGGAIILPGEQMNVRVGQWNHLSPFGMGNAE